MRKIVTLIICCLLSFPVGKLTGDLWAQSKAKIKPFSVMLDAGHGGKDPGTIGNGLREKDITLSIALKVGKLIKQRHPDVKVFYTRQTDVFIPLQERANIANRHHADLFISIHVNSAPGSSTVAGTETFVLGSNFSDKDERVNQANLDLVMRENEVILLEDNYRQKYQGFDPRSTESYIMFDMMKNKHLDQSITLGTFVQRAYNTAGRNSSRGVKKGNLLVLRNTAMPSILTEVGFISNKAEANFMGSERGCQILADGITKGFSKYLADYRNKNGIAVPAQAPIEDEQPEQKPVEEEFQPERSIVDTSANDVVSESFQRSDAQLKQPQNTPSNKKATQSEQKASRTTECIYRIQLITTSRSLSLKDKEFRGYTVRVERMGKNYAYTTGCASTITEARKLQRKIKKQFKDAFIVQYEANKRIKAIY